MQSLDNNMDELFRKAGEGYPLKTDPDGWDKISPLLSQTPDSSLIPNKLASVKRPAILIILLLLFFLFGTLSSRYIWKSDKTVAVKDINPVLQDTAAATNILHTISTAGQQKTEQTRKSTGRQIFKKRARVTTSIIMPELTETAAQEATVASGEGNNMAEPVVTEQAKQDQNKLRQNIEKQDWLSDAELPQLRDKLVSDSLIAVAKKDIENIPVSAKDTAINQPAKTVKINQRRSRFYIGALAGVSLNQVKNQGLQKAGFDVGIKAGYQFTKQFSIETGLLFEEKHYYTSGEYFNVSKIAAGMPVGMKVLSLKGKFSVCELPLTFKYNLPGKHKDRHFYTTAGISTYLISKEYNQYQTLLNGTQNNMTGIYTNQSLYSAALLNLSVGYEKNIGRSILLRVDPYVQLPIKGLGVGAVPVTTIGVHLGIFRFTHQ